MWSLKCTANKLIHESETNAHTQGADLWLPSGLEVVGERWSGSLGLADANDYIHV